MTASCFGVCIKIDEKMRERKMEGGGGEEQQQGYDINDTHVKLCYVFAIGW